MRERKDPGKGQGEKRESKRKEKLCDVVLNIIDGIQLFLFYFE